MTRLTARRVVAGSALALVAGLVPGLATSAAQADDANTLTVVGTSDVFDSNLVQTVIKPGFEAAFPGITLNYVSKGTGAAITYAEAGTASALLVHAASLENHFVGQGYSLEAAGRAIFWGDYVLLGPASDPAGVMTGSSKEDIVSAFQKIAAAGANGDATFVSRGGTPGTTVQEHAIWALTTGVQTCTVDPVTNGGGNQPSTATGACTGLDQNLPSWYQATQDTQAPNITAADACNFASSPDHDSCYVFTDRGTFNFLQSTGALSNLQVVVDNNDQAPSAQKNLLVNSFHLYGVNPATVPAGSQINTVAATDLLNWITSPAAQTAVGNYLKSAGAPFRPDAAPQITASALPKSVKAGKTFTVKGNVSNVVPGTPHLSGVGIRLLATAGNTTSVVGKDITGAKGGYTIKVTPKATASYSLVTPGIEKIEVGAPLTPVFRDLLQPSTQKLSKVKVQASSTLKSATSAPKHKVEVTGTVAPKVTGSEGRLELWAARPGKKLKQVASAKLSAGATKFDQTFALGAGAWKVKVRYTNPGLVQAGASSVTSVRVS